MRNRDFMCMVPPDVPAVDFNDWLKTLSADEQRQFKQAQAEEQTRRAVAVSEKKLTIVNPRDQSPMIFIFASEADRNHFMENVNPTWLSFWNRYSEETGTFIDADARIA